MTEEELKEKAENCIKKLICGFYDYCKDCQNKNYRRIENMCYPAKWGIQAYKDGYKQGQIDTSDSFHKDLDCYGKKIMSLTEENEELKERLQIESQSLHEQAEIVSKQVEQIEDIANINIKAQTIIAEQKQQIIKMKCCGNCKYYENNLCFKKDIGIKNGAHICNEWECVE